MWPMDLSNLYSKLTNLNVSYDFFQNARPFLIQEVIDMGGEAISKTEYSGMGAVTEFLHSRDISLTFRGKKPLHGLLKWGPAKGFLPSSDTVIFVDNHDSQRYEEDEIISFKDKRQYIMANVFMLAHPYGLPRLMSSFNFQRKDQGPPADGSQNIVGRIINVDRECESPWICEHRWKPIVAMIKFRNIIGNSSIENWADNGQNQLAFCRGKVGFIAFNNELSLNFKSVVQTCLPAGKYCEIISGSKMNGLCTGEQIVVDELGKSLIVIPHQREVPIVAIHINSKL